MPITSRAFVQTQLLLSAIGVLAMVTIVGMAIWLGSRSGELATEIIAARDLKTTSVELGGALQRAESSERGFLYTNNEVYLAPYDLAKTDVQRRISSLPDQLAAYPDLEAAADRLSAAVDAKMAEMDEAIRLVRERQPDAALDLVLTNRGKALMDEANVYLTGIAGAADERLSSLVDEQSANAGWQRLVAIVGALVTVGAASAALWTIFRYARELAQARDALEGANTRLEDKVASRTADLARSNDEMRAAKERAELLMHEVNHRVANSLAMVSSLVGLQSNASETLATREALAETQSRIQAIALVHKRLYASGDVAEVALDEYLQSVLQQFESSLGPASSISLRYDLDPLRLKTDATVNLGIIAAEWVMNAAKYAYPQGRGEVRVRLSRDVDGRARLSVEDDGVGRLDGTTKGTGLGSRIVTAMARTLDGEVQYVDRPQGMSAQIAFPVAST